MKLEKSKDVPTAISRTFVHAILGFINISYYRFVLVVIETEETCELPLGQKIYKVKKVKMIPFEKYEKIFDNFYDHVQGME